MTQILQPPAKSACLMAVAGFGAVGGLSVYLVGLNPMALLVALAAYVLGAGLAVWHMLHGYPHGRIGLCNRVTFMRLVLATALLAPLFGTAAAWPVLGLALIALALDGVDGWIARREGLVSDFGARFDMEVDAALGLILALNVWAFGTVGLAVLVLGVPRYLFVASAWVWPWMARPLPQSQARKLACAIQIGALIVLLVPALPAALAHLVLWGAGAVLLWSFGRDVLWLFNKRGRVALSL
jgi:phosphatidylglycerophosphate synthase